MLRFIKGICEQRREKERLATEETDVTDEVPEATPQAMEEFACDEPSPLSLLASEALLMPTFIIDCVGTFLRCIWCAVLSVVLWVSNLPLSSLSIFVLCMFSLKFPLVSCMGDFDGGAEDDVQLYWAAAGGAAAAAAAGFMF